jgi:hypothetical protein
LNGERSPIKAMRNWGESEIINGPIIPKRLGIGKFDFGVGGLGYHRWSEGLVRGRVMHQMNQLRLTHWLSHDEATLIHFRQISWIQ